MITMEDLVSRVGVGVPGDEDQLMTTVTAPCTLRAAMASMLNRRTGHARFRRGPVVIAQQQQQQQMAAGDAKAKTDARDGFSASASSSLPSTTLTTSVTAGGGEASVSGGLFPSATGRPSDRATAGGGEAHRGSCHCCSKRKSRVTKVIRVPAISSRNADIPPDDYSWRKYGQKPIKGSPYPRGYYKCSTVRGCPARKHVERDPGEPAMLIVTYEGDHRHDIGAPDQQGTAAITPA